MLNNLQLAFDLTELQCCQVQCKSSPYGVQYPSTDGKVYIDFFRTLMVSRSALQPILDMKAIMSFNTKVCACPVAVVHHARLSALCNNKMCLLA